MVVVHYLAGQDDPAVTSKILAHLSHPPINAEAVKALASRDGPAVCDRLLEWLTARHQEWEIRLAVAHALASRDEPWVTARLLALRRAPQFVCRNSRRPSTRGARRARGQ